MISDYPSYINRIDRSAGENNANWRYNSYIWGCGDENTILTLKPENAGADVSGLNEEIDRLKKQLHDDYGPNNRDGVDPEGADGDLTDVGDFEIPRKFSKDTGGIAFFFENDVEIWSGGTHNIAKNPSGEVVQYESFAGTVNYADNGVGGIKYTTWDGGKAGQVSIPGLVYTASSDVYYRSVNQTLEIKGTVRQYAGLNKPAIDNLPELVAFIKENKYVKMTLVGSASRLASNSYNKRLSEARARGIADMITSAIGNGVEYEIKIVAQGEPSTGENNDTNLRTWSSIDENANKKLRRVNVYLEKDTDKINRENEAARQEAEAIEREQQQGEDDAKRALENRIRELEQVRDDILNSRGNKVGCYYFKEITNPQAKFFTNKMREKIDYFTPAFHSQTPEDLNTRLTFLNQCTRPGQPLSGSSAGTNSLFGRPPVCVLRLGDFIYANVIIDSVGINYVNNIIWDMNPEGIGLQPMMAEITLSMKIIGGMSLQEPLSRLQNALDFNFYANTEIYDPGARRGE